MHAAQVPAGLEDLPDVEVARRIAAGDRQSFVALMRRHNQTLYRTARSILRDDAEAEDCVQEAYLHGYRAMGSFRGDSKLSTWLVRIVVNEAIGRKRRIDRRTDVVWLAADAGLELESPDAEIMSQDHHGQPERNVLRRQTRELIEASIDRLPETFRTVFVLRAVEDFSVEETAVALDIPSATVRSRYFRARAMLREALALELDACVDNAFSFAGDRCDRIVANVLARLDERDPP
jgi:RNA polymerase sigma-70 factor (ECF subfamily)